MKKSSLKLDVTSKEKFSYLKLLLKSALLLISFLALPPTKFIYASAKPVKLNLFFYKQEIRDPLKEMTLAFTKSHPNITIDTEMVPNDSVTVLKTRLASGAAPDIMQLQSYAQIFEFARSGHLLDLTRENIIKKTLPSSRSAVTLNGKIYALPMDFAGIGILYNKDIFKKLNLKPPTTFIELKIVANKLKRAKIIPFAGLLKANWSAGHFIALLHASMTGAREKTFNWIENMGKGKGSWADVVNVKELFAIMDFYKKNMAKNAVEWDWNEQQASFASGKSAMMVQGLWSYLPAIKTNPKLKVGFIPFPTSNKKENNRFFADVDSTFAISATASKAKVKAAKKFLEWLATDEAIKMWTQKCKLTSTFTHADISGMEGPFIDLMSHVKKYGAYPWEFAMYPVSVYEDATKNGAQAYFFQKITAKQFVKSFDHAWAKAMSGTKK